MREFVSTPPDDGLVGKLEGTTDECQNKRRLKRRNSVELPANSVDVQNCGLLKYRSGIEAEIQKTYPALRAKKSGRDSNRK